MRASFAKENVACVPNAVPLARIALVGRLTRDKGLFDLHQAVALLRDDWPALLRPELAGEGDANAVARHAIALGIGDRVLIRAWCTRAEREQLLARSGCSSFPHAGKARR